MAQRRQLAVLLLLLAGALPVRALGPEDVYLLVNRNVPESREVAEHYCKKRSVPVRHIVALDLPAGEDIARTDFNVKLRGQDSSRFRRAPRRGRRGRPLRSRRGP